MTYRFEIHNGRALIFDSAGELVACVQAENGPTFVALLNRS